MRISRIVQFARSESSSGLLLLFLIAVSLVVGNSPLAEGFAAFLSYKPGTGLGLEYSIHEWVNDGLMSLFFLLVGLEVKRSVVSGELSDPRAAAVPVLAAIGGCIVPAGIFLVCASGTEFAKGWAIPMATDIAFSLAVLNLAAGKRAGGAKVFLSTLAIADDLAAILVIALFYNSDLDFGFAAAALLAFGAQILLNRLRVAGLWPYMLLAAALWYFLHRSGIHATLAGVLTGFAIPAEARGRSPLTRLEHALLTPVNFIVVPLFVLCNTNVALSRDIFDPGVAPLAAGIIIGLTLGKPAGVLLFTYLSTRLRIGVLLPGLSWRALVGAGILAGIGFTISIFIAGLSCAGPGMLSQAKAFVLIASAVSGLAGFLFVRGTAAKEGRDGSGA